MDEEELQKAGGRCRLPLAQEKDSCHGRQCGGGEAQVSPESLERKRDEWRLGTDWTVCVMLMLPSKERT